VREQNQNVRAKDTPKQFKMETKLKALTGQTSPVPQRRIF